MGIALAAVLYPMINQTVWNLQDERPALEWKQFGILFAIILLFDFGILTESPIVLYPAAYISVLGVLSLLIIVFSMVWIMIMRQENEFEHVRQLWLPAAAGLTLGLLLVLGIDLFRFHLTGTWSGFPGIKG